MVPNFGTKKRSQPFVKFFNEWCPILGQKNAANHLWIFLTSGAQFWDKKTQPTICKFFQQVVPNFWDKKTQPTICKFFLRVVPNFGTKKRSQPFVNFFNQWCPIFGTKKRSQPFVNFFNEWCPILGQKNAANHLWIQCWWVYNRFIEENRLLVSGVKQN